MLLLAQGLMAVAAAEMIRLLAAPELALRGQFE
jgi:hypothetical protein